MKTKETIKRADSSSRYGLSITSRPYRNIVVDSVDLTIIVLVEDRSQGITDNVDRVCKTIRFEVSFTEIGGQRTWTN